MITFWPIQLAELGAVYAIYQKWLIRWPKPWILPAFLWIRTYTGRFAKSTIPWTTPDGKVATQKYLAI
jgi:hypothetical protein